MDKDRIEGSARQAKGLLQRLLGRLLGDRKMQVEGAAEQKVGQAQNAVGGVKDTLRGK